VKGRVKVEKERKKNGQFGLRHSHSAVSSSAKVVNTALFCHPEGGKTSGKTLGPVGTRRTSEIFTGKVSSFDQVRSRSICAHKHRRVLRKGYSLLLEVLEVGGSV